MSAYPGVRTKRLQEAYADRENKGYAWNNLMLSKWLDHNNVEHRVRDDYERNVMLIDLAQQPADLIDKFDLAIVTETCTDNKKQVGLALMRFCNQNGLVKIEKSTQEYSPCFSSAYTGPLTQQD
jgi:hypothetical protein